MAPEPKSSGAFALGGIDPYNDSVVDWRLWTVIVCSMMSFLFAGAETALTSLGRLETERLLGIDRKWRKTLKVWIYQPERILIMVLVGTNLFNILASSMLTLWAEQYYPRFLSLAIGGFTFVVIFCAEVLPKVFARQFAESVAPYAFGFLFYASIPLFPVTWVFEQLSRVVIWALGFDLSKSFYKPFSEEEVTQTIELATIQGSIDAETGEALTNLMDFPDLRARDVLTPRSKTKALHVRMTLDDVMRFMSQNGFSRYPVYRENFDDIIGIIHVKDLLSTLQRGGLGGSWTRAIRRPYFVSELASLGEILRDMKRWGTHLAVVRNETGVVLGLLTMEDLIEEIVGEIRDEHDDPSDGGLEGPIGGPKVVQGDMSIIDFNEKFGGLLPIQESYSTLNGYILRKCGGSLPAVGSLIFDEDFTFKITGVDEHGLPSFEVLDIRPLEA